MSARSNPSSHPPRLPSAWLVVLVLVFATGVSAQSSSTTYVLSQSSINGGGGTSTSTSFVADGSLAQRSVVGESVSSGFVLQSGFWTNLSTRLVVTVEGAGSGRGTVTGPGIDCTLDAGVATGDCTVTVPHGAELSLLATPDPANQFDVWGGCGFFPTASDEVCEIVVYGDRTLTASFTLLGTVGDRIWRDVDGDGVQDLGEPGLDGVSLSLLDGDGVVFDTLTTGGGGLYVFRDVPPGTYMVEVDSGSLPPGVVPSFDFDGVATPHVAEFTILDGEDLTGLDFGYQPLVDLGITKEDSADPLPGGDPLIYTITVSNPGPSYATDVVVTDVLPSGTTLVQSTGCAEDPNGAPTCSLGTILAGGSAEYTLEVSIDPAPPGSITNTATVASAETDLTQADNSASQSTELDDDPLTISFVQSQPETPDSLLTECETVNGFEVVALKVRFDEAALDPAGDALPGDVTNPNSWSLVFAGDDAEFSTVGCGTPAGDDESVDLDQVTYDAGTRLATVVPDGDLPLGLYRLLACGNGANALTDLAGNPLDGDGDGGAGGDFVRGFRADPENLLQNGYFDCELEPWSGSAGQITHSAEDRDGSADSGSAAIENVSSLDPYVLDQCVALAPEEQYRLDAGLRLDTEAPFIGVALQCDVFGSDECAGGAVGSVISDVVLAADTGGQWIQFDALVTTPAGTASARCGASLIAPTGEAFDARFDQLRLRHGVGPIFEDDFESGDTSAWSGTTP